MKTGIKMVQDGYSVVNVDAVKNAITGKVYMYARPKNSNVQDVVLNTLTLSNTQVQEGVFNCNIHCPNKKDVVIGGKTDNTQPDIAALDAISQIVTDLLNIYIGNDFRLRAQNTGVLLRDVDGTWYVNIRVYYSSFQNHYINN